MTLSAAIRLPVLILLTAVLAGSAALGADARLVSSRRIRPRRSQGPDLTLSVGLDGSKGDEDFGGNLFQPFVTLGNYWSGLDWELRARGLFSDEEDGVRTSGVEGRAMVGWGWEERGAYSASLMVGGSFRTLRVETDEDLVSDFGPSKYDCKIAVVEFGARFRMLGGDDMYLVAEISGGPLVFFEDDQSNEVDGGMPGSGSYVFETYLGFTWNLPELGGTISIGGAYEELKIERDDDYTIDMEKISLRVSLNWKF